MKNEVKLDVNSINSVDRRLAGKVQLVDVDKYKSAASPGQPSTSKRKILKNIFKFNFFSKFGFLGLFFLLRSMVEVN